MQLFRAKANRPPLLTNPRADESQNLYNFSVSVQDVEKDEVSVRLELLDPQTGGWIETAAQTINGNGTLFWPAVTPPVAEGSVAYRFMYDDGYHSGSINPPPALPPTAVPLLKHPPN
ncbi:MAG: hypothetical protein IPG51_17485 [Chloroflexi bacterium]|nr:hypothetical protein [Chloroflexota bacterium]